MRCNSTHEFSIKPDDDSQLLFFFVASTTINSNKFNHLFSLEERKINKKINNILEIKKVN